MIMETEKEVEMDERTDLFETEVRVRVEVGTGGGKRTVDETVRLPRGAMGEIARALGGGQKTVYNALRRGMTGKVSDRVKLYVLERYGAGVPGRDHCGTVKVNVL